ncbi:MAG: sulfatase-like hydrolase/transferase [Acidobacteriota bacterium]
MIHRISALVASLTLAFLLTLPAAAQQAAPSTAASAPALPDVLLITVDTLRPDALGWIAGKNETPVMDRLAAEGVAWAGAVAPTPITLPSHAALMTGWTPGRLGVRDNGQPLGEGVATLAERMAAAGWKTGAFVSGYPLASGFGLDRGFDFYDEPSGENSASDPVLERRARETVREAQRWLQQHPEPTFLWIHLYDPHDPYDPPEDLRPANAEEEGAAAVRALYDAEVQAVDRALGELFAVYGGRDQSRLTVFTADHGESLGEHGEATHGFFIYDATILVPLVFHWPGNLPAARRQGSPRLVDIAPTLLDLLDLRALRDTEGISLTPFLGPRRSAEEAEAEAAEVAEIAIPAALVESYRAWFAYGWAPLTGLREERWKLIRAPRPELFELEADPGELENLVNDQRREARRLADQLREREQAATASGTGSQEPSAADEETLAKLRSLGYTGAGAAPSKGPAPEELAKLADPKDRIELWNLLGEAEARIEAGNLAAAVALYDRVLGQEPRNPYALSRSGWALLRLGETAAAVSRLKRAVDGAPWYPEMRQHYAEALTVARRLDEAVTQLQELVRLQPQRASAWSRLGTAFGLAGQPQRAAESLERAHQLAPQDGDLHLRLAFALHGAGQSSSAAEHLLRLAQKNPEEFIHGASLGALLAQLDRPEEARRWLLQSQEQHPGYAQGQLALARLEANSGKLDDARATLQEALQSDPRLEAAARQDPLLAPLLP